jgi:hypothetical protein
VRPRLAIIPLCLAWLCANGALWDVMQCIAWGKMFAGYTETMSVAQALRETFDPAKPCDMCGSIAQAKDTAKEQLPGVEQRAAAKFVLALHTPETAVFSAEPGAWLPASMPSLMERTDPVPLPPPRV